MGTLTSLFKDIAVAVEQNEEFVAATFGAAAVLDLVTGLQQACLPMQCSSNVHCGQLIMRDHQRLSWLTYMQSTLRISHCQTCSAILLQVCEQAGTKVLQRYIQWRRLQQLMREISSHSVAKRSNAPAQAALAVDPRQVCAALASISLTPCQTYGVHPL